MGGLESDTIRGFNAFLEKQRKTHGVFREVSRTGLNLASRKKCCSQHIMSAALRSKLSGI
jgi:hypothetical protein